MSDLRFKITDQSEEAIRQRAAESVIWNENEARVPTRISDALWAAVRDRESLLGLLRVARATPAEPGLLREALKWALDCLDEAALDYGDSMQTPAFIAARTKARAALSESGKGETE